ncbi:MAG: hypothetical protein ABI451_11295, partial [Dokdonella sp.]
VSMLLGAVIDFALDAHKRAELATFQARAYISVAQFAPWNIAQRYIAIVFTQGDSYAEQLAQKQEQQSLLFRGFACSLRGSYSSGESGDQNYPCAPTQHPQGIRAFYLSAHVPLPFRPLTAFFDLLVHAFFDQGIIGFLVAALQVIIGALLTRYAIRFFRIKVDTLVACVIGVPFAILALGSVAAIPLWLLALAGMTALKALPAAGLGVQAGGTAWFVSWVGSKTAEVVGQDAIMKQVERVVRD